MSEKLNTVEIETGWLASLREALSAMKDALSRFPVTVVFLCLAALYANAVVAGVDLFPSWIMPNSRDDAFVLALIASSLASFSAALFSKAWRRSAEGSHVLSAVAGLAAFAVMWPDLMTGTVELAFLAALVGLAPLAPFLGKGTANAFWMFTARLAFAAALALIAFVLFGGGISAILASLTHLFDIGIPNDLYEHIWASTGLFVAPLFGLGQTPLLFDEEPGGHEHDLMRRGMRALGDFAAVPLLIVYAVILHLYAAKIVVTGTVPQGQIGWLVLTYGVCIFAVLLLTKPFLDTARAPTRFFVRFWPLFLLAPLGLLFYALWQRVEAFGWTPERYFLGLFGLVTLVLILLQCFSRLRGDIRLIAAVPVLALLLGSFGPQGALHWSIKSQQARFLKIVKNTPLDSQAKSEALSALRYIGREDALLDVAPAGFSRSGDDSLYRQVARSWGLDPDHPVQSLKNGFFYNNPGMAVFGSTGFDIVVQNAQFHDKRSEPTGVDLPHGVSLTMVLENNTLSVTSADGTVVPFPVDTDRVIDLFSQDGKLATLRLEAEGREVLLVPSHLNIASEPQPALMRFSGTVLLRSRDWR